MNEQERLLQNVLRPVHRPDAPDFDSALAAAERRLMREVGLRRQLAGGTALAACLLISVILLQSRTPEATPLDLDIETALMTGTGWRAPSDSLLPNRQTDLYSDLPGMPASTDLEDRTLL